MPQNRIGPLRRARGLTLEQLAELTGIDYSHLSRLQSGQRGLSVEKAEKLAEAFGVSAAEVLGFDPPAGQATPIGGLREDEVEPYEPGPTDAFQPSRHLNRYFMTVRADSLSNMGLRRGDQVEIDGSQEACANVRPLAAVCVQYHPDPERPSFAVSLLRQFIPPAKLITNSDKSDAPMLDMDRDDAVILGVVVSSHRRFG